jgi:MtN3 and saliva related transmembrane protein
MPWFMLEILGYGAAICTTAAFAPQLVKAWRTRSTNDISLAMFLVMVAGIVLWLTYGALKHDVPLIVANATTLVLAGAILFLKLKYK